jgi:hypothetical protein
MPPKAPKPTSDELLAQFDDLGLDKSGNPSKPGANAKGGQEEDILAELDHLAAQRPASGPGTPRLSIDKPRSSTRSPRPSATIERPVEEKPVRQSEETSQPSRETNEPPTAETENAPAQSAEESGGWWGGWGGGLYATATAAMKQAEAAVKEIQNNEEAQKWAQQVKGNVSALRDLSKKSTFIHRYIHDPANDDQAANFAIGPFQPSPVSSTPSHPPFPRMNVFKSMSPTTYPATQASIL